VTEHQSRWFAFIACAVVPIACGVTAACLLHQDANWDLRNYHWYNAYAFLTDRYDRDILPAHIPTFYNPVLDIPFFVLAQMVPARAAAFGLGVIQGLNFVLLYLIAMAVLAGRSRMAALGLAAVGLFGGGHLGLLGTTFYDNVLSLFVLAALALLVRPATLRPAHLIVAGVLVGIATGLKLPSAVFAVGLCAGVLWLPGLWIRRIWTAFVFGVGVLGGIAVAAGQWMWFLWTNYHNPIFPYFNGFFRSPLGVSESYRDTRFVPENLTEWLVFPVVTAIDPMQAGEIVFRDYRIAAAFAVLLMTLVLWRWRGAPAAPNRAARLVISASVATYVVWLMLFAIYRYIIPLEMVAPMVIVAAVAAWPLPQVIRDRVVLGLMAVLAVTTMPGTWGRIPFGDQFVTTTAPELARPDATMVLMLSNAPTAWVIPTFPPEVSFVRVQGYGVSPDDGDTGLNRRIAQRIADHGGDYYTLAGPKDHPLAQALLARYGLTLDAGNCRPVVANLNADVELCAVTRINPS
jgi:hypothetical protein